MLDDFGLPKNIIPTFIKGQIVAKKAPPTLRKKPKYGFSPLWDWTQGVTQSSLESFMACREQFALGYVEGWSSRSFSVALEFGTLIHFMLEQLTTGDDPVIISRRVTRSYASSRKDTINPSDFGTMEQTLANAEAIFPHYVKHWQEYDAQVSWLKREHVFRIPHKFLDFSGVTREVDLTGMRDGDIRDIAGGLGLFETKTKSSIDDIAIQDGLRADLQTCLYLYSLRREYREEPTNILYNIIRRPQLRIKKDEPMDVYKQRVSDDIAERPEWYFRRFVVTVVPGDIENFIETTLDPVLRQMYQWWESIKDDPFHRWASPYHYRSLPALMTKYGKAWHYNLSVRGLKNEYYQKSSPFPELHVSLEEN